MPHRTPTGRHARIPNGSTERRRLPVARVVAVAVITLASVGTLIGLTMRPAVDAGGSPSAEPASSTTQSSASAASHTSRLDTPAHTRGAATNATASARPDPSRTSGENTDAGDARDKGSDDRTPRREPTTQTSVRVGSTEPPSPTTTSSDEREKTGPASATPSPQRSGNPCESLSPSMDPRWSVTCRIRGLLP